MTKCVSFQFSHCQLDYRKRHAPFRRRPPVTMHEREAKRVRVREQQGSDGHSNPEPASDACVTHAVGQSNTSSDTRNAWCISGGAMSACMSVWVCATRDKINAESICRYLSPCLLSSFNAIDSINAEACFVSRKKLRRIVCILPCSRRECETARGFIDCFPCFHFAFIVHCCSCKCSGYTD